MKGTIKRGSSFREDQKIKREFFLDEKNRAENVMIVDLLRNDLGRICFPGEVWVKDLFKIETYPTLHQMISTIKGRLIKEDLLEILKALFPCGSVTGAPKIRAMEIIAELEKEPRGVYTGGNRLHKSQRKFSF
jgi:para-aminobenzoate synthetase/4-amino-4-deoxychorismate lyase